MGLLEKGLIVQPIILSEVQWGNIKGTLSNQEDLTLLINTKEPLINMGSSANFFNGTKQFAPIIASNVVTDSTKRFISDADFNNFNSKSEKRQLINFTWTIDRQGFSSQIASSATPINFLQFLTGTPAPTIAISRHEQQLNQVVNFTFDASNPLSPILIFPVIDGEVDYQIRISISGSFGGATSSSRIMPFDIQRASDNTFLGNVKYVKSLGSNNVSAEFINITTRTIAANDNFSETGIRLLLTQDTNTTFTLTRAQLYIKAEIIKLN